MKTFPQVIHNTKTLYKLDTKGNTREWTAQVAVNQSKAYWRTVSGLFGGNLVTSEWREAKAKNVGRSNATTAKEQAMFEANAAYKKKCETGFFENIADVDKFEKFKPMLATDYGKIKLLEFPVYTQPKLDGIRCIARKDGLWTRSGKPIVSVPHIWEEIKGVFNENPNFVFDGELYNHELKDDFNSIVSMVRKTKPTDVDLAESARLVQYHIYDMFDSDRPHMNFSDREFEFNEVLNPFTKYIKFVPTYYDLDQSELNNSYYLCVNNGYEGQIIRLNSPYENKRSKNLIKRKDFITEEFSVVDVEEGQGNWSGHIKKFKVRVSDGVISSSGVRGTQEQMRALYLSDRKPDWATVRYFGITPAGSLRMPVVVDYGYGQRDD